MGQPVHWRDSMMEELHPLLLAQLAQLGLSSSAPPSEAQAWAPLLVHLSRVFTERDEQRRRLEQCESRIAEETARLCDNLRAERDQLDARMRERTEARQRSEARLQSLLSLSADWIWEQDAQLRFTYVSEGIEAAIGLKPSSLLGRVRFENPAHDTSSDARASYEACMAARQPFRDLLIRVCGGEGGDRYVRSSGEPVFSADGEFVGYRGVSRDVTEAVLAEYKMHELARYDSLTGLPNRSMFVAELDRTIARATRQGSEFAVCFIDLDRFKTINDTLAGR